MPQPGNPFKQLSPNPQPAPPPGPRIFTPPDTHPSTRPPLKNLGDILDFQHAAILESIFRKGSEDANRLELRKALGIQGFYEQDPVYAHKLFDNVVTRFIDNIQDKLNQGGRGVIDTGLDTFTDPLTYESLGGGPALRIGGRLLRPLAGPALRAISPVSVAAKALATKLTPQVVKEALAEGRTVANSTGRMWAHIRGLAQYAPEAKAIHGVPKVRESIASGSRMARRYHELDRRLQETYASAKAGLNKNDLSFVQQALHGQIPVDKLTPAQRVTHDIMKNLGDVVGPIMQHHPGGGSISAVSKFSVEGPKGPVVKRVAVAPKISAFTPQELRRQVFSALKKKNVSVEERQAALHQITGKPSAATATVDDLANLAKHYDIPIKPKTGSRLLNMSHSAVPAETTPLSANSSLEDWVAGLRAETKNTLRQAPEGAAQKGALDDLGTPILKRPQYVKGPFGKAQRNPSVEPKRTFTVSPNLKMNTPPVPEQLKEFSDTPGEFTAANVRHDYYPGKHYRDVVSPNQEARTLNPLESHNPHLKTQKPFIIQPKNVEDFDQAFSGMLKSSARAISHNELRAKLAEVWGMKQADVEKHLPREIFDLFTKKMPATGDKRQWQQVLDETWRGLVNLPKAAVVGAGPFHIFNMLSMMAGRPQQLPKTLALFGRLVKAGADPAKRWEALGREAAEYGLGQPLDEARSWTKRVPLMKTMKRWTWDFDTAATFTDAEDLLRSGKATSPLEAGQMARERLVDYDHRSKLQEVAKYVAPFAQYATAAPGVVVKGVVQHPARTEFVNRLTGGKLLGGGDPQSGEYYGPTAKVGRLFNIDALLNPDKQGRIPGIMQYGRGMTSPILREGISAAGNLLPSTLQHGLRYLTYGADPLSKNQLLQTAAEEAPVPYMRTAAGSTGLGTFKPTPPLNELIFGATGYSPGTGEGEVKWDATKWNTPVSQPGVLKAPVRVGPKPGNPFLNP